MNKLKGWTSFKGQKLSFTPPPPTYETVRQGGGGLAPEFSLKLGSWGGGGEGVGECGGGGMWGWGKECCRKDIKYAN